MNSIRLRHHLSEDLWELAGIYSSISTESAEKFLENVIGELKRRGEIDDVNDAQIKEVAKEIHKKQVLRHNVQQYISEVRYNFSNGNGNGNGNGEEE